MDERPLLSRRKFLRQASCAALGTAGALSTIWDLRKMNAAVPAVNDYKALVCLFLHGGNDSSNTLVPRSGSDYTAYQALRSDLALPQTSLLPLYPTLSDGRDYGLHPACSGLQNLFNTNKLAVLCNVGTLVAPITRAQYLGGSVAVPPQLFSHNDQAIQWQTSIPDQPARTGWGGRCADLLSSVNAGSRISMSISLAGTSLWEAGNTIHQYQVTPSGSVGLTNLTAAQKQAMQDLLVMEHGNLFENAFADITSTAIDNDALLNTALNAAQPINTAFPGSAFGNQLRMVARLIAARQGLNMKRQIFFCAVGGYDTHAYQYDAHAGLLSELSQAMTAFYNATVELGVSSSVTTFTASDFGRTLPSNGNGSDHGWGSHQFVLGGAVQGKRLYGTHQVMQLGGPDDTELGRWIPSTAVDQYAATLARWFGVPPSDLPTIFPNIGRFASSNLGFMG